jgi:hypothetical protein
VGTADRQEREGNDAALRGVRLEPAVVGQFAVILVRAVIRPQGTVGPVLLRLRQGEYTLLHARPLLEEPVYGFNLLQNRPSNIVGHKYNIYIILT